MLNSPPFSIFLKNTNVVRALGSSKLSVYHPTTSSPRVYQNEEVRYSAALFIPTAQLEGQTPFSETCALDRGHRGCPNSRGFLKSWCPFVAQLSPPPPPHWFPFQHTSNQKRSSPLDLPTSSPRFFHRWRFSLVRDPKRV